MSERLRRVAVLKLTEDLHALNGAEFEQVGHHLVSTLEGKLLIHRGLNASAKPVGYTVDTFDGSRTIVAEYSTEVNYFSDPYTKIRTDAAHARGQAADLIKLYLLSNQDCPESHWEDAGNAAKAAVAATGAGKTNATTVTVELFDARRVAETIYDQVVAKTVLYGVFVEFLPSLEAVWRDFQFACNLPPIPSDYVGDQKREDGLMAALLSDPVVVVHGISGIGKSYLIRNVVSHLQADYENILWLTGDDLGRSPSFSAVRVERLGTAFNLTGQFNATKTLLVVDSWEEQLARNRFVELEPGLASGSRLLVSSQLAPGNGVRRFPIVDTDHECATQILTWALPVEAVDSRAADTIVQLSGGHPLLMSIIRDMIANGDTTMRDVALSAQEWTNFEDDREHRILERVLGAHAVSVQGELVAIKWLGTKTLDNELAKQLIGFEGVRKLRKRSLLHDHGFGLLRMHDLVSLCLRNWQGIPDEETLRESFLGFFADRLEIADFHFQRALHTCSEKIVILCGNGSAVPDMPHYLYLLLDLFKKDIRLVSELSDKDLRDCTDDRVALQCIFEAREVWRHMNPGDRHAVELDEMTVAQVQALQDLSLTDLTKHVLFHHQGKAYRRLKRELDAVQSFKKALELCPEAMHTHLQLARHTKDDEKAAHLRAIIKAYNDKPESVAITVVLEAVVQTARSDISSVMEQNDFLKFAVDVICASQAEGYGQPFEALGSVSRMLWYRTPDALVTLAGRLSLPPDDSLARIDPKTVFGVAETMKNVAKALREQKHETKSNEWMRLAEPYYNRITTQNGFQATMVSEYWVLRGDAPRALSILSGVQNTPKERNAHYYHRRAQAHSLNGDEPLALADIDRALGGAEDRYLAAFLDCKAEILLKAGDRPAAKATWQEALRHCDNGKFRDKIQANLDSAVEVP